MDRPQVTRASILVLVSLALLLAACPAPAPGAPTAAPEDEAVQQIKRTVNLFFAGEDAEAICEDALSEDYIEEVYGSVEECEEAQEDNPLGAVAVTEIEIEPGESAEAQAEPAGQASSIVYELEFVFEDGVYKIDEVDPPFPGEVAADPTEEPEEPTDAPTGDVEEQLSSLIPEAFRETCTVIEVTEPGAGSVTAVASAVCYPAELDDEVPVRVVHYYLFEDASDVVMGFEGVLGVLADQGIPAPDPGDCETDDNVIDHSPPDPHGPGIVTCLRVQESSFIVWSDEEVGTVADAASVEGADRDEVWNWWVENAGPVGPEDESGGGGSGESGGPPVGRYLCYQVPNYEYIGWVELYDDGSYGAGFAQDDVQTDGRWSYDSGEQRVMWSGGWYEENWPVTYYVEPGRYPGGEERTGTGADRDTLALKVDLSNPVLPGQESFANPIYVYCYLQEA